MAQAGRGNGRQRSLCISREISAFGAKTALERGHGASAELNGPQEPDNTAKTGLAPSLWRWLRRLNRTPHHPDQDQAGHGRTDPDRPAGYCPAWRWRSSWPCASSPGLAANIKPSSTNRMPKPMRKSANAMDLIGLEPPVVLFLSGRRAAEPAALCLAHGFAGVSVAVLPVGFRRYRKKSESGRSRKRVSFALQPVLIGLHRAVEGEEVGILAVGLGEDAVALGVAVAARLLGLSRWPRRRSRSPRGRPWSGSPAPSGRPARGTRPPRAGARSACAGRPPGCSAPADRRGGCGRRRPAMP